jgi:uncharacterized protein (TIGR03067 family)
MNDAPEAASARPPSLPANVSPTGAGSRLQGGSLRLFQVAGIEVWLHWSWFLFALLRLQSDGSDDGFGLARYHAQVWYAIEYVALFAIVLLHEFGHVLACRMVGGIANRIVLWPLGGIAYVDPPGRPGAFLWSIAGGPLVNVLLVAPTLGFWQVCRAAGWQEAAPDLYRFAVSLAWINGYLLVFNVLPVYPLDGGKILQALLWFVMGRARSLMAAAAVGLLTALALLVGAIVARSLVWEVMAGFGLVFSLVGVQAARGLLRMRDAPRQKDAACPDCKAAAPVGNFWACLRCFRPFDVFATGGTCPNCGTPLAQVFCPECGRSRPYVEWLGPGAAPPAPAPPQTLAEPPTVGARVVCGLIFAIVSLLLCGFPNMESQPLGLVIWTAGGAILGAMSAGTLSRGWKTGQARKKLRGTWRLVEEDGQPIADGPTRSLILTTVSYEERMGDKRDGGGVCWTDPLAQPPAISLTPKTGPDAGQPRPGIYRREAGTLTLCLASVGQPRPTTFEGRPGVQQVRVYRRGNKAGA